jgi:hypothetical protein
MVGDLRVGIWRYSARDSNSQNCESLYLTFGDITSGDRADLKQRAATEVAFVTAQK